MSKIDIQYRHEWKYEINYSDLLIIRQRLRTVAEADPHARNGMYQIRSLYFDNTGDKALREKIDGVDRREKFRIRCYNNDYTVIHLEKKNKRNGLGTKVAADLSAEEVRELINGKTDWMRERDHPLIRELYCKMQVQGLKPKTMVQYIREPFIYRPGNVRVTFDRDIRTGLSCTDFLNPDCVMIPAGNAPILMEIKWDEYLPDIIRDAVWVPGRREGAFSKYAQCRIYG